jgi:hypothetical protein
LEQISQVYLSEADPSASPEAVEAPIMPVDRLLEVVQAVKKLLLGLPDKESTAVG